MTVVTSAENLKTSPRRAKAFEQVALTIQTLGLRKVAFGSADTDQASAETARQVADVAGRAGRKVVVIDLSGTAIGPTWLPGGSAMPEPDPAGGAFHCVSAPTTLEARAAYNDQLRMSAAIDRQFADYDLVILSLAGLGEISGDRINAVAAGAAADGIVVVCPTNLTTQSQIQDAMELVEAAGGKVVGCVMDDRANPTLASEVGTSLRQSLWFLPPLARWAAKRAERSSLLQCPTYL